MSLVVEPVTGLPLIEPGDALGEMVAKALAALEPATVAEDVVVVTQKVVSKAEGRLVELAAVEPGSRALELASVTGKDPRLVQVILGESRRVVRAVPGVLIAETRLGFVCANAGVDFSNVPGDGVVALLPADPDASARRVRGVIASRLGAAPVVLICDSHGRPWRLGTVGVAIGSAGIEALYDVRGRTDLYGRALEAAVVGRIDELASAATLVMGEAAEAVPVVRVRGAAWVSSVNASASDIQRPMVRDLFR